MSVKNLVTLNYILGFCNGGMVATAIARVQDGVGGAPVLLGLTADCTMTVVAIGMFLWFTDKGDSDA